MVDTKTTTTQDNTVQDNTVQDTNTVQDNTEDAISQNSTATSSEIDSILKELDVTLKTFKNQISRVRTLKKDIIFLEKSLKKLQTKKTKKKKPILDENGDVKKNGFARPTDISDELADFLGVEKGVQIARTEVTKRINAYVKEHDLQDPERRRCILLTSDAGKKLKKLLSDIVDNQGNPCELNFINIQKYIKHHFPKRTQTPPVTQETSVEVKKKIKKPLKKKTTTPVVST